MHLFCYGIKFVHHGAHCVREFTASIVDIALNIFVNKYPNAIRVRHWFGLSCGGIGHLARKKK